MSNDETKKEPSSLDVLILILAGVLLIGLFGRKTEGHNESN